jgi:peptidoglycan/LPS O-acetylase OafA/YrhL
MKLGKVEGSPQEIRNFIQDSGLNVQDYLERPEKKLGAIWFVLPSSIVLIAAAVSVLIPSFGPSGRVLAFIGGCAASIWLAVVVHVRYKSAWASSTIVIGSVVLLLVAAGLIGPLDVLKQLREIKK